MEAIERAEKKEEVTKDEPAPSLVVSQMSASNTLNSEAAKNEKYYFLSILTISFVGCILYH